MALILQNIFIFQRKQPTLSQSSITVLLPVCTIQKPKSQGLIYPQGGEVKGAEALETWCCVHRAVFY